VTVPPLCNGGKPSFSLVASYISLVPGRGSVSENLGNFTAICAPTGAIPGSKISTELKVAPGILLAGPKPTACLVAKSTDFILSSCSGAPGTQLTLTPRNTGTNVGTVQFTQNTASTLMNAYATVGRSGSGQGFGAAAYTVTVPQLCNQGLGPSFSLVVSYYTSLPQGGFGTVSENLGTFTAICAPTATGAFTGKCPGSHSSVFFSSCSAAMGTQVTVQGSVPMNGAQLYFDSGGTCCGATFAHLNVIPGQPSTFIVPQLTCGTIHLFLPGALGEDVGNFTVICPAATASPNPTPIASPKPTPTASPEPKPTKSPRS
jgi:hypothetical protein